MLASPFFGHHLHSLEQSNACLLHGLGSFLSFRLRKCSRVEAFLDVACIPQRRIQLPGNSKNRLTASQSGSITKPQHCTSFRSDEHSDCDSKLPQPGPEAESLSLLIALDRLTRPDSLRHILWSRILSSRTDAREQFLAWARESFCQMRPPLPSARLILGFVEAWSTGYRRHCCRRLHTCKVPSSRVP